MPNENILGLPQAVSLTGAEWIPLSIQQLPPGTSVTRRAQLSQIPFAPTPTGTTFTSTAAANVASFVWGNGSQTVSLSTRDSAVAGAIGVGYMRATTTNTPTVLDIMPNGTGGSNPTGVSWIDICDRDLSAPNSVNYQTLLLACGGDGSCRVGTHYGGTGTGQPLTLGGTTVTIANQAFGSATTYATFSATSFNIYSSIAVFSSVTRYVNSYILGWTGTSSPFDTQDTFLSRNGPSQLNVSAGTNGQQTGIFSLTESLTLSTGGTTTQSVNSLPANAIILGVSSYVLTTISGGDTYKIAGTSSSTQFSTSTTLPGSAGSSDPGTHSCPYLNTSSQTVTVTTSGTPSSGALRLTFHYLLITPATS